jgi:hypothetical protein
MDLPVQSQNSSQTPEIPISPEPNQSREGDNSTSILQDTNALVTNNGSSKFTSKNIHLRKINKVAQNKPELKLNSEAIDKFRKSIGESIRTDNPQNEQLTNDTDLANIISQNDVDIANLLSQKDGVYSLLIGEDGNQSLFFKVIETRIKALENHNNTKKNKKLTSHIKELNSSLNKCRANPTETPNLIKLIDECDEKNSLIGLGTKLLNLLLASKNSNDTTNSNCSINTIDKKNSSDANLINLDNLYKSSLVDKHSKCISQILETIESAERNAIDTYSSAVILPDQEQLQNKELLQLFIEQKPEIAAELIYDRALIYTSIHNKIGEINNKNKAIADKMLQSADAMHNTPESINEFLSGLTSDQHKYFVGNLENEIIEIQVKMVEKQLSLANSSDNISTKIQQFHACKRTITLLNNNYKPNNKSDKSTHINKLTELLVKTKTGIISRYLDMQYQLKEATSDKKKVDEERIILLKKLDETEISAYLQSTGGTDKLIRDLLNHMVDYVDYLSQYNNGEASKEQKIKLQNSSFDLLKTQQELIDYEVFHTINNNDYKSKLIDAKDFNAMQQQLFISNTVRHKNMSLFRISSNIRDNFSTPHISYEPSGTAMVEENLNEMVKESLGYNFWSMFKSIFSSKGSEKANITLELEKKDLSQLEATADKDSNFVFNSFKNLRSILHFQLQYMTEASKRDPALFKELASQFYRFIPVLRHTLGKDTVLSTLLQDISKKINDSKLVNKFMEPKGDIPLFDDDLKDMSDIALTMKKVMLLNEVLACFNDYGLTVLRAMSTLLPHTQLLRICEAISKETTKTGGTHIATSVTFYLFSAIKDNQAPTTNPVKSFLENYNLRWITSYTRMFSRMHTAVKAAIKQEPEASKTLLKEISKVFQTILYTAIKTALIIALTSVPVFLFNISLPAIGIITAVIFIAAAVFHVQVKRQYGITENNISLAILADMFYNKGFDIEGHYNHPKNKKVLQKQFDQLTRYDSTGVCVDDNKDINPDEKKINHQATQTECDNIFQPNTKQDKQITLDELSTPETEAII